MGKFNEEAKFLSNRGLLCQIFMFDIRLCLASRNCGFNSILTAGQWTSGIANDSASAEKKKQNLAFRIPSLASPKHLVPFKEWSRSLSLSVSITEVVEMCSAG